LPLAHGLSPAFFIFAFFSMPFAFPPLPITSCLLPPAPWSLLIFAFCLFAIACFWFCHLYLTPTGNWDILNEILAMNPKI
jgi:hypothetical protein